MSRGGQCVGIFVDALLLGVKYCFLTSDEVYRRFKKEYKTVEELKKRFATFVESAKLVERHNKEKHSYTLAVNGRELNELG